MATVEDAARASCRTRPGLPALEVGGQTMQSMFLPTKLLTVGELVDLYYTFRLPELAPRSQTLSKRYLGLFREEFGHLVAEDVTRREFLRWLKARDHWPSQATKKSALNRIKAMYGWAMREDDLLRRNPLALLSWQDAEPRRSMTDAEFDLAWQHAPPIFRRLLWFLKYTGCRPGEAAALEWSMIDWQKQTGTLKQHKTAHKTNKPRVLYFCSDVMEFLRLLHRSRRGDLVFTNRRSTKWTSCQMAVYWGNIRRAAGLADDCILYGLRHRFGTLSALANPQPAVTAKLMGHESPTTTAKYYTHVEEHHRFMLNAAGAVNDSKAHF